MSTLWKEAISDFIADGNEQNLRAALRTDWIGFYPEDKDEIFRFLFLSKQYKLFLYFFAIDLQSQIVDLPWLAFLEILAEDRLAIPDDLFKELKDYFVSMKLSSNKPVTLSQLLHEFKEKSRSQFFEKIVRTKQELMASARIAQSEQLLDQHVKYMNELKRISPTEYNVSSLISDQQKRKAEKVLLRRTKRSNKDKFHEKVELTNEEQGFISLLLPQAEKYLAENKAKPEDFAYLFRSFGDHKTAIEFVYLNNDISQKDWQLLDYLFSGKQYVSLLDHCQELKRKYADNPDSLFSISYAEAVAYWELGENDKAIDIMEQISSMRPNFKSATETLNQWKEENFE